MVYETVRSAIDATKGRKECVRLHVNDVVGVEVELPATAAGNANNVQMLGQRSYWTLEKLMVRLRL